MLQSTGSQTVGHNRATEQQQQPRQEMEETWVRSLDWEDPLEEGMATHSSILAWRIPTDRGAWRVTVHGSQSVGHE